MSYDSRDGIALSAANDAGIKCFLGDVVGDGRYEVFLRKIQCPCNPNTEAPEKLLANAIDALTRLSTGDTIWVEVLCDKMPQYVFEAFLILKGFGCRSIVTHAGSSTHGKGPLLSSSLCDAVKAANEGGNLWHPIDNKFVTAR